MGLPAAPLPALAGELDVQSQEAKATSCASRTGGTQDEGLGGQPGLFGLAALAALTGVVGLPAAPTTARTGERVKLNVQSQAAQAAKSGPAGLHWALKLRDLEGSLASLVWQLLLL